jgi:hypothetical protein
MSTNTHWIQIDLEYPSKLDALVIWHKYDTNLDVARGVVIQVSDTPEFSSNSVTFFNNDYGNLNRMGVGSDYEYYETRFGKIIPTRGVVTRYVRLYCRGFHQSKESAYLEVEAWGCVVTPNGSKPNLSTGEKKTFSTPPVQPLKIKLPLAPPR